MPAIGSMITGHDNGGRRSAPVDPGSERRLSRGDVQRDPARMIRLLSLLLAILAVPGLAVAQQSPADLLNLPIDGSAAAWIIRTFGLLTILSVAPGILIMVTSFPRFVIAFSILRSGMGLATAPSNRSEEHTSELPSIMRISYAVFCLNNKQNNIFPRRELCLPETYASLNARLSISTPYT